MSTLALRAAALFSHERVLCISAQVALEQATRAGKIWEHPHPVDREAGGTGQRLIAKGAGDDLSRVIAHPERDRLEITILVEAA